MLLKRGQGQLFLRSLPVLRRRIPGREEAVFALGDGAQRWAEQECSSAAATKMQKTLQRSSTARPAPNLDEHRSISFNFHHKKDANVCSLCLSLLSTHKTSIKVEDTPAEPARELPFDQARTNRGVQASRRTKPRVGNVCSLP